MEYIHETHHLSKDKEALVYNFFGSESEAKDFIEANKDSDRHYGISYHCRVWDDHLKPPEGVKSYWHGDFGHRQYSQFNQL